MDRAALAALPSYHNYTNSRCEKFTPGQASLRTRKLLEVDKHVDELMVRIFL
jgi:hypothetical protein